MTKSIRSFFTWYFGTISFEKDGKLYEAAGIRCYKKYLIKFLPLKFSLRELLEKKNTNHEKREVLINYIEQVTIPCEILHIFGFIVFCFLCIQVSFGLAALITVLNVPVNIYPVILQRYNRNWVYSDLLPQYEEKIS